MTEKADRSTNSVRRPLAPPSLNTRVAAVDDEFRAGGVLARAGGKIHDGALEVLGVAHAALDVSGSGEGARTARRPGQTWHRGYSRRGSCSSTRPEERVVLHDDLGEVREHVSGSGVSLFR